MLTGLLHVVCAWDQAARFLTGLRLSWILATVLRHCTHSTTTATAVVVTDERIGVVDGLGVN